jgi:hypothetical protein
MTPKEKALELWEKYFRLNYDWDGVTKDQWAKEGALIAVDEILKEYAHAENHIEDNMGRISIYISYWQEVKQEIEKL